MRPFRRRPAPATVIALVALFVALGGTSYGAFVITGKNVKNGSLTGKDVKNNSLTGDDVKNGSLRGRDVKDRTLGNTDIRNNSLRGGQINESTLGKVPSAASADAVVSGNRAFSTFHDASILLPTTLGTIATLNVPAGRYVVIANATMFNQSNTNSPLDSCSLTAGGDSDLQRFDVAGATSDDQESYTGTVVHDFAAAGAIGLSCQDGGTGDVKAQNLKITALQVGALTNTGF